jgi:hypothetical protein
MNSEKSNNTRQLDQTFGDVSEFFSSGANTASTGTSSQSSTIPTIDLLASVNPNKPPVSTAPTLQPGFSFNLNSARNSSQQGSFSLNRVPTKPESNTTTSPLPPCCMTEMPSVLENTPKSLTAPMAYGNNPSIGYYHPQQAHQQSSPAAIVQQQPSSSNNSSMRSTSPSLPMSTSSSSSNISTGAAPTTPTPNKFANIDSVFLKSRSNDLLNKINEKRTKDEQIHSSFRADLIGWGQNASDSIIGTMYAKYDGYSKEINQKFKLIADDFSRIEKLENELKIISSQIEAIYTDFKSSSS